MKIIGICSELFSASSKATFDALGEAFGVSFQKRSFGDDQDVDAWIVLEASRKVASEILRATRPCYVVLSDAELISCGKSSTITFSNRSELDTVLRSREVTADDAVTAKALPDWLVDVLPLAFKSGSTVWAIQERGGCRHHYVSLLPPELNDGDALFTHFSGQRMARLLPLVLFVRSLAEGPCWEPPPLQATFMFDDPNLHGKSYGFIDYLEMVKHADAGNYHVSIATIPLDSWFVHAPTSAIFRENTNRISLLYHGNDHLSKELARSQSASDVQRLLRQAVGRVSRMETRTGLEVARVMAPPHGACNWTALSEMACLGFEAVCVSRGSLRHYNDRAPWTRTIGMRPCDVVAGLPVIPRFGLSKNCRNDILIAALLRQPIVPMTHHQAIADGYDLLNEMASFVNSLGEVKWSDMKTISRSLYSRKLDEGTLRVRMVSKRISVPVPPRTTRIEVERPRLKESADQTLFWQTMSEDWQSSMASCQETIAVQPGARIEIAAGQASATAPTTSSAGSNRLAPVARRLLTELRDRALPSIYWIARRGRSSHLT